MNLYEEFQWREMLYGATEGIQDLLARSQVTGYIGFDPTAASLHVGSLLPIMGLVHMQRHGHTPIALAGGGTGLIGDPSGKTVERQLLTREKLAENLEGIRSQLAHFLDFESKTNPALLLNNADWLTTISMVDFLREIGKHFTVNYMLAKESVKNRYERGDGISFTEFSYMLLQAYDFLQLHDRHHCILQMGGSDQWGNIVAGTELIRKLRGEKGYGLVFPLVTTSAGVKFGKTEAGAVWLDPKLTSPFRFYQFWFHTDDQDVVRYLKCFTLLDQSEINELAASVESAPEKREAQRRLAREATRLVHGDEQLQRALQATQVLFGGEINDISASDVMDIFADVPSHDMPKSAFEDNGLPLIDALVTSGYATSKGAARRLIEGGGIYVNNRRNADITRTLTLADLIEGQFVVLRKGAREYHLLRTH
jgi:tyrosyl-tRNA synthetase